MSLRGGEDKREREVMRVQRLLRRLDLERVLEEGFGLEILWRRGSDVYLECPDPNHLDANPSFHVCVEDVEDDLGRSRLGCYHCWSHPMDGGLSGRNFLTLAAKVRFDLWEDEDGDPIWPKEAQRAESAAWLRREFLSEEASIDRIERIVDRRTKLEVVEPRELIWPPSRSIVEAPLRFAEYLESREITLERSEELGVLAVENSGRRLRGALRETIPGVLFPIKWNGVEVNWYLRGISRGLKSSSKGRYCPGIPLGKGGFFWAPDGVRVESPKVVVEGIFDAERVRTIAREVGFDCDVVAVLGGRLYPEQVKWLRGSKFILHLADGDEGGITLGKMVRKELEKFTRVFVRVLPDGKDPADADAGIVRSLLRPPESSSRVSIRFRSKLGRRKLDGR